MVTFEGETTPNTPARIFLSHKSADKAVVRDYKKTLELLGLKPWLDEDDLPAGAELHRGIQNGMRDSVAAIFFITPQYKDEQYLRAEINYAIAEKMRRGDSFAIITLVLDGAHGKVAKVPEPLEPYVWKTPETPLQGLREIIRALPAAFREIKPVGALTAEPKVRVTASAGQLVSTAPNSRSDDVVLVRIENHGSQTLHLTGGVSFDRDDTPLHSLVTRDANGAWPTKAELRAGDGLTIPVSIGVLKNDLPHIKWFFFQDELGRQFRTTESETRAALRDRERGG